MSSEVTPTDTATLACTRSTGTKTILIGEVELHSVAYYAEYYALRTIRNPKQRRSCMEDTSIIFLGEELHKRIVGQDQAITEVVFTIRKSTVECSSSCKPIGTFLFVGPMGVGKRALAKAIASCLCKTERAILIVDMKVDMWVLGEQIRISNFVRERPNAVILVRKIDKAPTDILDRLLKIFDEGECGVDSTGHKVSFTNTVLILFPSNDGSECLLKTEDGEVAEDMCHETKKNHVKNAAKSIYGPTLMDIVDEFIIFNPLDIDHITSIVRFQLEDFRKSWSKERRVIVEVSESAVLSLGVLAARYTSQPAWFVKDVIKEYVQSKIEVGILKDEIKDWDKILVDTVGPEPNFVLKSLKT